MTYYLMLTISLFPLILGCACLLFGNQDTLTKPLSKTLFMYMIILTIWQFSVSLLYNTNINPDKILHMYRFLRIGITMGFAVNMTFYYFLVKETNLKLNKFFSFVFHKKTLIGIYIWSILSYLISLSPYQIKSMKLIYTETYTYFYPIYGKLIYVFYVHFLISIIFTLFMIFISFKIKPSYLRSFVLFLAISILSINLIGIMNFSSIFKLFPSGVAVTLFALCIYIGFMNMQNHLIKSIQFQLRNKSKMEYFDMNTSGLIHELKNPLSAIKGYSEIIPYIQEPNEDMKDLLKNLELANHHMENIILEFSNFVKSGKIKLTPTSVRQVVIETKELLNNSLKKQNVEFSIYGKEDLVAYLDKDRMRQVLMNLCKNGIDAIPENQKTKKIEVHIEEIKDNFAFFIKDNGSGIPKEKWNDIFKPFETTKETGMGLGLSLVYRIVSAHAGTIEIIESSSEGTIFKVEIPKIPNEILLGD